MCILHRQKLSPENQKGDTRRKSNYTLPGSWSSAVANAEIVPQQSQTKNKRVSEIRARMQPFGGNSWFPSVITPRCSPAPTEFYRGFRFMPVRPLNVIFARGFVCSPFVVQALWHLVDRAHRSTGVLPMLNTKHFQIFGLSSVLVWSGFWLPAGDSCVRCFVPSDP